MLELCIVIKVARESIPAAETRTNSFLGHKPFTLIEVFGHIVFSFTRGVTEHYNPEEPEYTAESFGYDALQSTGLEWYYHPVDELIYQEYNDREVTTLDYLTTSSLDVTSINACSSEEHQETQEEQQREDEAMAWKRLRPSALRTVCQSTYIGALISLLTASIIGSLYMLISYVSYQTILNCQLHQKETIPVKIQWIRTLSDLTGVAFLYMLFFVGMLFLFRPYQLTGVKTKLILVAFLLFCLDALYPVLLQVFGISHSKLSVLQKIPLNVLFLISVCWQVYIVTNHFRELSNRCHLFLKMTTPSCFTFVIGMFIASFIYRCTTNQMEKENF